ncbi:SDR family oxidoreductase (plasmid) [Rhizobium sp. TRM96647]|uniref:SDR family oxidoreductase n=1 Tax=unclassified Rhizobium TaxID=2613769 RepID=UPI0021E841FB|nr:MULTISPECIES: SDR family oxidoreductase [unclassified Rhizobium]MCV3735347.1 SDR family oxidoreductase [Rhizobium sp. TRM96647]MCV3757890.1 SDR family oxidoreductase [Rhizobium sp. TRM96650]
MTDGKRRILVTGATRGLGLEIARAFAREGATVALNGRDRDLLESHAAQLRDEGLAASALPGDLSADAEGIVRQAAETLGVLDAVVHAASLRDRRSTEVLDGAAFAALLDVNLTAAYRLARAALPLLRQSAAGRLIFVTSIAARIARAPDAAYTASKGGLEALTRSLAVEFGSDNLTVNAIAPGWFVTDPNRAMAEDPRVQAFVDVRIPLRRWGRPEELAPAALFLASPAASFVNGITLTVDGGMSAQM